MFKTNVGPGSKRTGYMRPETAQGIFTDYSFLYRYFREQLPFGVVQIGKSFRNEISPRQGLLRLRAFTQMEAEVFVDPKDGKKHPHFARMATLKVTLVPNSDEQPHAFTIGDAVAKKVIANETLAYFVGLTHRFLVSVGVEPTGVRFRQHRKNEMAHYANDCWDAEFHSDRFGWVECVGIADRGAFDLTAHAKESGVDLVAMRRYDEPREVRRTAVKPIGAKLGPLFRADAPKVTEALKAMDGAHARAGHAVEVKVDGRVVKVPPECFTVEEVVERQSGETFTPHVIEPSYGVDRILYAVLEHAYKEEAKDVEGAKETYRTMALPPMVAPMKVGVFPLVNKGGLPELAEHIAHDLGAAGLNTAYDDGGTIGRRYARMDEVGTPFCVTVDFESVESGANKDTVTVRERDSGVQTRVKVKELAGWIRGRLEAPLQKVLA
jgi:glycyl-tRNA synthetase